MGKLYIRNDADDAWIQVSGGQDTNAIHDDRANEITGITEKTSVAADDVFLIEDSAASYVKKKLKSSNLVIPKDVGFCVGLDGNMTNIAIDTDHTVEFDDERYDVGSDFNTGTYTFTAPVGGYYMLIAKLYVLAVDTAITYVRTQIVTSNFSYYFDNDMPYSSDLAWWTQSWSVIADMDASDTAYVTIKVVGGAVQTDVENGNSSQFMGYLLDET